MRTRKISIVMPAYKAETAIGDSIKNVKKVLKSMKYKHEIICVVDGNIDNTYKIANKISSLDKCIKVFKYQKNRGKGYAVRYGMSRAKGDIIGFIDVGDEINPNNLFKLIEVFEKFDADIVAGSKRHPESKIKYPLYRKIISHAYRMIVKSLFELTVKDTQAGIKLFKKRVIKRILPKMKIDGFAFDVEIFCLAKKMRFNKVFEAPISVNMKSNQSNLSTIRGVSFIISFLRMFWDTILIFYRFNKY